MTPPDANLNIYNAPEVVGHYASAEGLQPCEVYAFEKYIKNGDAILDLGMGGGRTTPHLCAKASHYIGADYSSAMVEACKQKFPNLEFHCEDASNLGRFAAASFDVVVFSFNGIDYIRSDEARARCLQEVWRVLRPGGRFIFSSHNAKAIAFRPIFLGASAAQVVWRIGLSIMRTITFAPRVLISTAFRKGTGYILDPTHGGLATLVSSPETISAELGSAGFDFSETVSGHYPAQASKYTTPWYYYVASKPMTSSKS